MEAIAIALYLSRYLLAVAAVSFCILLFRYSHRIGWLFLGALFLEPFFGILIRLSHGRRLLAYRKSSADEDGIAVLNYTWDVPVFYFVAVVGLFLLFREARSCKLISKN